MTDEQMINAILSVYGNGNGLEKKLRKTKQDQLNAIYLRLKLNGLIKI